MIQILGLRPYFNKKKNKEMLKHSFFDKQWRADSVHDLFANLDKRLEQIPEAERFNLFYTVANTHGKKERDFNFQTVLPIDIDGTDKPEKVAKAVCADLGLSYALTGVVASGNGTHLLIALEEPIDKAAYFDQKRVYYKALCKRINAVLAKNMLKGVADPAVFDKARILRLPGTRNIKPNKDDTLCKMLNAHIEPQGFTLEGACGVPDVAVTEQIAPSALKNFPKPDTKSILAECKFLDHCNNDAANISELQWYAMLSILPHLEDGRVLAHDYSRKHPGYTSEETDDKIEQAMSASGPRTCNNINGLWDGCKDCKHFNNLKSPILIQGPEYIRTKDTGFHDVIVSETGKVTKKPNYEDLLKYFKIKHPFKSSDSGVIWGFTGKFWEEMPRLKVKAFAESNFEPAPKRVMREEFIDKVKCNHVTKTNWFDTTARGHINFSNGVLDTETGVLHKHSTKFGFRGVLPYDYNPTAICPTFDNFLKEITQDREDLIEILLEYMGYALSGDDIWIHKVLFLQGEGANGKSTFMDMIKYLVGKEYYSSLTLTALNDDQKRSIIEGKLVNLGDETRVTALTKSEVFKTISAGGDVEIKRLYAQPYEIKNKAKFIVACNKLPYSQDATYGFHRRMLIVPFDATFVEGENADPKVKEKMYNEAAGIFNKAMAAYGRVKEQGKFTRSATVDAVTDDYKLANDGVTTWFEEFVTVIDDGDKFVPTNELYSSYKHEAIQRGEFVETQRSFEQSIGKLIPDTRKKRKLIKERRLRGYAGVLLAADL